MTLWTDVLPEHQANVGFVEGPGNANPWGPEQGVSNASYCDSAACMVPYHHGVRWPAESQFGEKGCAYCPFDVDVAVHHGWFALDLTSRGQPCDLLPGDKVYFSWGNNGVADHVETVIAVYADGTFDTIGYNTGHPEGCHVVRRDRKYLLGRWRMVGSMYIAVPTPQPKPQPPKHRRNKKMMVIQQSDDGQTPTPGSAPLLVYEDRNFIVIDGGYSVTSLVVACGQPGICLVSKKTLDAMTQG